jgi:SEC-C motif domain protein
MSEACPCGTSSYAACCGPRHSGSRPAETAEALMRSRYSAYALGLGDYLVATNERPARPGESAELTTWGRSVAWVGLRVEAVEAGGVEDDGGFVRFSARFLEAGALVTLTERSRFSRVNGAWKYVEGTSEVRRVKLERNAPCPCGSGRKAKQCHL